MNSSNWGLGWTQADVTDDVIREYLLRWICECGYEWVDSDTCMVIDDEMEDNDEVIWSEACRREFINGINKGRTDALYKISDKALKFLKDKTDESDTN